MDGLLRTVARWSRQGVRAGALAGLLAAPLLSGAACSETGAVPPLAHTFESPEQLASVVVEALEQRDADRLGSLALSEEEFKTHVWPRLPISRPERGVPFGFAWSQLHTRSRTYLRRTLAEYGGTRLDVVGVRFAGETTDYGAFVVSRDAEVIVRDGTGRERGVRLFGSVLQQQGRYKLFSYVVD